MKPLIPCLVVGALAAGVALHLVRPAAPSSLGVVLRDKATGETIEYGLAEDNAGHAFFPQSWTSKTGEKIDESYEVLSATSARLHFAITDSGVTRKFDLTVPVQNRRTPAIHWLALDDHFETVAYAGGLVLNL
jgi:hypothetical protein